MEDDLTKLSRTTATDDQDNGLPDRLDDSSVSDWYVGADLGKLLDPSQRLLPRSQPDVIEELLDSCLQILSVEDNPGIKTANVSTQTEPEQTTKSRKSRKFIKGMKGGIDRVLFYTIQSYMSPGVQYFSQRYNLSTEVSKLQTIFVLSDVQICTEGG